MTDTTLLIKRGIAVFPSLQRPDFKFNDLGIYKASVKLPYDDAVPYMKTIGAAYKAHVGKVHAKKPAKGAKGACWYMETDDEGEETGYVVFNINVKNIKRKDGDTWDRKPVLIDAKRNKLGKDVNPWGGSTLTVKMEIYPWTFNSTKGVSLQPLVVQVIDLVSGSGRDVEDVSDFDEEEGYEADTSDFEEEEGFDGDASKDTDSGDY